ncbi:MAG: hypothetical protein HY231_14245 [Acidobacteria bacterium]|nr:hypothetical protein [Acidobacteriota bacterium]
MSLTTGKKVFYPSQGLCLIGPVVQKVMGGQTVSFYHLSVLEDGGDLFVPVDKIASVGIRPLIKISELPRLLNQLKVKSPPPVAIHYSQRVLLHTQLIASGSPFDLAEVIGSLTECSEVRSLSNAQRRTLDRARRLLIGEIAEVTGKTKEEVNLQIDEALAARKEK